MNRNSALCGALLASVAIGLMGCGATMRVEENESIAVESKKPPLTAEEIEWEKKVERHKLTPAQVKRSLEWIKQLGPRREDKSFVGTPASEIQEYLDLSSYVLHLDDRTVYGFYLSERKRDPNNPEGPQMQFYVDNHSGKICQAGIIDILW